MAPRARGYLLVVAGVLMALLSCAGRRPTDLGVTEGRLRPCPVSPNCVCSDDAGRGHIAPFELAVPAEEGWQAVRQAVEALPRTRIVRADGGYLHAECSSALMGFVDDLELSLRPEESSVAVRSASRLGWSDMGVNRRRVEELREALRDRGVLR